MTVETVDTTDVAWRTRAACRTEDPELFFPMGSGVAYDRQVAAAKQVCAGCPVRAACLAANRTEPFGVFGGLSEEERAGNLRVRQPPRTGECRRCRTRIVYASYTIPGHSRHRGRDLCGTCYRHRSAGVAIEAPLSRRVIDPVEAAAIARQYRALQSRGWSLRRIAAHLGMSPAATMRRVEVAS